MLANPVDPFTKPFLEQIQLAGRTGGIEIAPVAMVRSGDEVDAAFASMVREQAQAVVVQGIFFSKAIADLAIKHRLPAASVLPSFVHAGGLISYGANTPDIFQPSAVIVHKILQGAKPEDLPVEQPTKFELTINLKTAKALGITVPPTLLARADELIEYAPSARIPFCRCSGPFMALNDRASESGTGVVRTVAWSCDRVFEIGKPRTG